MGKSWPAIKQLMMITIWKIIRMADGSNDISDLDRVILDTIYTSIHLKRANIINDQVGQWLTNYERAEFHYHWY